LAQNLATMTGGNAQVANFRHGLFGPESAPLSNLRTMFGQNPPMGEFPLDAPASWQSTTPDDRAARYMAWMGLGGTSVNIPESILQVVSVTRVLDKVRHVPSNELSANMLSQAKSLCLGILGPSPGAGASAERALGQRGYMDGSLNSRLIFENGDAEMWMRMCSLVNPSPVHIAVLANGSPGVTIAPIFDSNGLNIDPPSAPYPGRLVPASVYQAACAHGGPNCAVGDENGTIRPTYIPCDQTNVLLPPDDPQACNKWPWCLDPNVLASPITPAQQAWLNGPSGPPICPPDVIKASEACKMPGANCFGNEEANTWAVRGAVSTGMAVFLYLKDLETMAKAPPDYNQCPK
jgi:hypothetical protein